MRDIRLLDRMFIPGTLIGPFTQANPGLGGVCTFVGEVRQLQRRSPCRGCTNLPTAPSPGST